MQNDIQGRELGTGYINPIYLRIGKYNGGKAVYRSCHFYVVTGDNQLDLYRCSGMRIERFASFNNVSFVEEIDNFPEEEVAAAPEPPADEPTEATGTISDDDIPF
jgi:hypothetical protein